MPVEEVTLFKKCHFALLVLTLIAVQEEKMH